MIKTTFAVLGAAALLACAPAVAQNIATLPTAQPLSGTEKITAAQGAGCPTRTAPCATVAITPAQVGTYLGGAFQAKDTHLDAIAALTTTSYGRDLLTRADAAALRAYAGLGTIATQAASGVVITGGSVTGIADLAVADGGTGASTGAGAAANLGMSYVLAKSGVAASTTGGMTEVVLASVTIPAGAIGPNGQVEIVPLWSGTSSANTKTYRVRLGGVTLYQATATTVPATQAYVRVANRNSASSQVSLSIPAGFGQTVPQAVVSTTVTTAAATTLEITAQLATGTETATLESYLVRITPGL